MLALVVLRYGCKQKNEKQERGANYQELEDNHNDHYQQETIDYLRKKIRNMQTKLEALQPLPVTLEEMNQAIAAWSHKTSR